MRLDKEGLMSMLVLIKRVYGKCVRYLLRDKIFINPGYGEYLKMIEHFEIVLADNPVLVEVGSLDGRDSIQLAQYFSCRVHCFEPNPIQIPKVRANISGAGLDNRITLYPYAVSSESGTVDFMYSGEENPGASSLYAFSNDPSVSDHTAFHEQISMEVECIRLDGWMSSNSINCIDLLFMDCQGSELEVLKSLGARLADVNCILLEGQLTVLYEGTPTIWEIDDYLCSNGFKLMSNNLMKIPGLKFNNFYYKKIND